MKRFAPGLLLLIVFAGCSICSTKKVNCPAFTDPYFNVWFPYTPNELVMFKGPGAADTLNFLLQDISESTGYETTQGGYGGGSAFCTSSKVVIGRGRVNMNELLAVNYVKDVSHSAGGAASTRLEATIAGSNWIIQKINNNSLSAFENNGYNVVDSSYNVNFSNGVNYPVLATITNDTMSNKNSRYYRLFIAKGVGVVGFDEYPSNKRWVVQ